MTNEEAEKVLSRMKPKFPKAIEKLSADQKVMHQAWLDLGKLLDHPDPEVAKEINRIRVSLFVPGKHHVFVYASNQEPS